MAESKDKINPRKFWDDKILGWENGRYAAAEANGNWRERLANRASSSLRFRLRLGLALLAPHVEGRRVVEIGCGSGLLIPGLFTAGAKEYMGLDISEAAINNAKRLVTLSNLSDKVVLESSDISSQKGNFRGDIVFSLGLLDWLTSEDLQKFFVNTGGLDFLHSISEKRFTIPQLIHRAYVSVSYGHRTKGYKPSYYKTDDIKKMIAENGGTVANVYRDRRLSFGTIITSLPLTGLSQLKNIAFRQCENYSFPTIASSFRPA